MEKTEMILNEQQINTNAVSKDDFKNILMQSPFAFALLKGPEMIVRIANESIKHVWGKGNDVEGKTLFEILPEIVNQGFPDLLSNVYNTGINFTAAEKLVYLKRNDKLEEVYFNFVYQPFREDDTTISGVVIIAYEVTLQATINNEIATSEKKFKSMADLMPVKVTYGNADGKTNYYNQKWLEYSGLTIEELKDNGWEKIIHPDDSEKARQNWQDTITSGYDSDIELRILNKEGQYNWHLCKIKGLKDENGKLEHWIGVNTEIQHQKKQTEDLEKSAIKRIHELQQANASILQKDKEVKESKEKLMSEYSRSLIEASLDPLITISTEGIIMDVNEAMVAATDIQRSKLIGTSFEKYFTVPSDAKAICKQVFSKGFVADYPLTIKDGKLTDVLFNGSVFKNGAYKVLGAVLIGRDISEQKKIEKELIEAKVFAELATSIAEEEKLKALSAVDLAEDAVKSKQQFLSNMSHEIRTPMNAIIGFTKVVLKTELTVKQKEYLDAIKMSGDALIVLINDILDLAKVDAGKMIFEQTPFKLALSVNAMLHLFDTKMQEKNLQFVKKYDDTIPAVLIGDPARLHQIILNLISNAVKFTAKGTITVGVKLLHQNDKKATIEFSVSDTGIGIAENKLVKVFENFHQASSDTSRLYGGTGLGLAIVKHFVEAQGGTISVKSKVNEGTNFSFILEFKKTNASVSADNEIMELDQEIKDIKVLVVEDMVLNQLLMKTLLDDFGFETNIVSNGKLAIEKLKTEQYDIVLMDLQMPEMNGFETTEYIRNTMQSKIPIIALTADVTTVDLEKCKAAGMDDYIAKPIDERLLYSKLVGLAKKPVVLVSKEMLIEAIEENKVIKCIDLKYLNQRTKSNPVLMMEMIAVYLEQTPPLISLMTKSFITKDWDSLHSAVHKMIPSFTIMGINPNYEIVAKKVQGYAKAQMQQDDIHDLIIQLENILVQSCKELEAEYNIMKNNKNEKG